MNEELKVIISAEIGKLKQNIAAAKGEISKFASNGKADVDKVDEAFKKAGETAKSAFQKIGTAIAGAVAALAGVSIATQEYRDDMAKLASAFDSANLSTDAAKTAYQDLYRVIGETDQAVEASQQIALLANSEKDVAKWSDLAAGVVAKFGDALQPETFFESANETLKLGEATGAYVQMLEGCGVSVDEFNKGLAACTTEEEKQAYMLEYTEKCLGAAGEAFEKNNAKVLSQRDAQIKLQEALANIGDALAPVITAFTVFAGEALAAAAPYLQSFAEKYLPTIQTMLSAVADGLAATFEWASQHKALLAVMGGIILTVVTAIGMYNAVAAIKAAMAALEVASVWGLVTAYAAQAAAMLLAIAPYVLIVAAIAGFIAIVVKAYKENETFRNIVDKVFNNIKGIITNVMNIVKSVISTVWTAIKTIWNGGLKQILELVLTILGKVVESFTSKLNAVLTFVSGVFKAVSDVIKSNLETAKTIVTNVIGLIKAIFTGDFNAAKTAVSNILNAIVDNFKTKLNSAKTVVKSAIDAIKGFFKFEWSLPRLKLPRISISGKFSLNPPSAPRFSINWNKLGGVFDKPTIFPYGNSWQGLGEAGAEAIVPLEKNTQWLDKIADKLAARQGNIPIVLEVDGKTFAQTSIDSINALTRQQGKLTLNLA